MRMLIDIQAVKELKRALRNNDRHTFNQIICRLKKTTHIAVDEQLFKDWQTAADLLTEREFIEEIRQSLENMK